MRDNLRTLSRMPDRIPDEVIEHYEREATEMEARLRDRGVVIHVDEAS